MSQPKYLTRQSNGITVQRDEDWQSQHDHWSSPDGCHEDCPACADQRANAPEIYFNTDDSFKIVGGEAWKLDVGAECNAALNHADILEKSAGYKGESFQAAMTAIRSLVRRVAEFEELETE